MSRIRMFFGCIGRAVYSKGLKALVSLVPFGEAIYVIAEETFKQLKSSAKGQEQIAALAAVAQASPEEAKHAAEAVVAEIAAQHAIPAEAQIQLVSYLTQVPSAVRRTLKRPSDPAGTTVPAAFALSQPEQLLPLLPHRLPTFKPGDRPKGIGNWELVELLGAGGFGEVWKARHPTLHNLTAALKFCLDPTAAAVLRHEAALLDRVMEQRKHEGIVPLRQAYLDADPLCLEYEYVNGGDLAGVFGEWQRSGTIPRRQVNRIVLRLAEIVAEAHRLQPPIVHRDLKPANILIERTPEKRIRLRVTDFGIGGVAATQALDSTRRGQTKRGEALATSLRGAHTPNYASPQQARGEAPDPRDDVHALGVIWYQLLAGDLTTPIPADWISTLEEVGQERALIDLLGSCVASKPEKRLASAVVLAERLDHLLQLQELPEALPAPMPAVARAIEVPPLPALPIKTPPTQLPPVLAEIVDEEPKRKKPRTRASRAGGQVRSYAAPNLRLRGLIRDMESWLRAQGFHTQDLRMDDGSTLLQIEQRSTWRNLTGMSTALNITFDREEDDLFVEIGAGKWIDKATAGVVSLFVLAPLAVTAAIGAWNQMKMPEKVFGWIDDHLQTNRCKGTPSGLPPEVIAQLRELAALRDQGILSDQEFQVQKAKLLDR